MMRATLQFRCLIPSLVLMMLIGCGGGSEDSTPSTGQVSNRAPVVAQAINTVVVEVGESVDIDVTNGGGTFSDPDGDTLSYSLSLSDTGAGLSISDTRVVGQLSQVGRVTVTVTASDDSGASTTLTFDVVAADNNISGKISFDDVPATIDGLDYDAVEVKPVRGVYVELLDETDQVLQRVRSSESGEYRFAEIDLSKPVSIRIKAELIDTNDQWYVRVVDNTRSNRIYAAESELGAISSIGSVRDLHLNSGWTGSGYGEARSAAPFAILDVIHTLSDRVRLAAPSLQLEPLNVFWSERNVPEDGDETLGQISTDSYFQGAIYLLGAEDVDTAEYDDTVIAHEWIHYLQDAAARDDSIGGSHAGGELLDFRVSFSEGYATALGVYLIDATEYIDTYGSDQRSAFHVNPDTELTTNQGWFNESSVMRIIFDSLDGGSNDDDGLSISLSDVLSVHGEFTNTTEFISIYSWYGLLSIKLSAAEVAELNSIMGSNRVYGRERYGLVESNDGGKINSLPVYDRLLLGQTVVRCMDDASGTYNKLDNSRFFRFEGAANQSYRLTVARATGIGYPAINVPGDPDYFVYAENRLVEVGGSGDSDRESSAFTATKTSEYRVALREYLISEDITPRDDEYCYEVTLTLE